MSELSELKRENRELRLRLAEAEEALSAIREGRVDAIVVEGERGSHVFSLTGSETVYRLLVQTMYEGALTIGLDGTILFCNQRFCDLMKTPMSESLGRKLSEFIDNGHAEEFAEILKNVQSGPVQLRMAFKAADATSVPVQLAAAMFSMGESANICIVASDLTELDSSVRLVKKLRDQHKVMTRVQKELRGSHEAALNLMEDAIKAEKSLKESMGRFALLARTASELLRSPDPMTLIEPLCRDVMHFLDCDVFFNFLADATVGRLHLNAYSGIPNGEAKRIEWLDFGAAVCGCAAGDGGRAVAERIQTASDKRTEPVKSYGVKAYACHPLLGSDGRVIGALSFGTRSRESFTEEDLELMKAVTDQVAVAMMRKMEEDELKMYKEGLETLVGKRTAELQKSQEQLLHSQKMEAMGQMAGGIAHDFNNMMQVVTGFAQRTLRALDFENPLRENLKHIHEAAKSASALTHNLLAFSRRQILQPKVFSLNELISKSKALLSHTLGEDIIISYFLHPELDYVKADPARIEQVIVNMAVNARHAMPGGGILIFQTSNVTIGDDFLNDKDPIPPGGYVLLSISDTGCGMKKEVAEKIFEPFFTTRPQGKGTGLGLSTAYGTIRQSGGAIRVHSKPDMGTTFEIYLPRTEEPLRLEEKPNMESLKANKGVTILVVEDNELALKLISLELADLGYHRLTARNAEEAFSVSRAHAGPIHLLLTDVILPGPSGRDISKILSAERPEIATLYMSGYDLNPIIRQGKFADGDRLLPKPFSSEQLANAVDEALNSRKPEKVDYIEARVISSGKVRAKTETRILVVDDDPGIAKIFADILREPGTEVQSAEDGATALRIASEFNPNVVLLDIRLPDMDGGELSRRIRDMNKNARPFIIAATGLSPESESAIGAFDAYVTKPVDFERIKELIAHQTADKSENGNNGA